MIKRIATQFESKNLILGTQLLELLHSTNNLVRVAFLLIYPKKQIKRENFNFVTGCLTYKMFGPKNYQLQQREACKYELNYFTVNSIGSFYLFSYGISELL